MSPDLPAALPAPPGAPLLRRAGYLQGAIPEEIQVASWIQYSGLVRRHWKFLSLACAAGMLMGLLLAATTVPIYQAAATLEVQGITDNLLRTPNGDPNAAAQSELTDIQTQIRIMQSQNLFERVVSRLQANRKVAVPERKRLAKSLTVRAAGQTRIIEILADSSDPALAADFLNTLADEYIQEHVEARWQGTELTTKKLGAALAEMRASLEQSEDALQSYARQTGLLFTADRNSVEQDRLRQLQGALSAAQSDRVARQSRRAAVFGQPDGNLEALLGNSSITALQERITDLKRQLAELSATYTSDYPKVKRLEAQIAPLEAAVRKEVSAAGERVRSELEEAQGRESLLRSAYSAQSALVTDQAQKQIHYDTLKREVDSTRQLYDSMLARVKEAGIASAMRASNVRVLDPAKRPVQPYEPRTWMLSALGGLGGLLVGAVFVAGRENADRTIQAPGDLGLFLNIPEFGAVPATRRVSAGLQPPAEMVTLEHRPSVMAESFRSVLASLLFAGEGAGSRVLVLTSANPGEGKTTVATNLAIALGEIGSRVLLIDGDLRRPRLGQIFRLPETPGLTEVLGGNRLADSIRQTSIRNVCVLPSGATKPASPDLLYSPRLKEVLGYARENFDIVLIDTPPMLQIPDARILGRVADSVILVVRAGKTSREAALAIRQRLAEDGTPVTGSILNNWNPRKVPGGYYGQPRVPLEDPRHAAGTIAG